MMHQIYITTFTFLGITLIGTAIGWWYAHKTDAVEKTGGTEEQIIELFFTYSVFLGAVIAALLTIINIIF